MHLNSTGSLKEIPIDADDDDAWVEALMGQVCSADDTDQCVRGQQRSERRRPQSGSLHDGIGAARSQPHPSRAVSYRPCTRRAT